MKMVILRVQMIAESFKMPTNCEILVPAGCERDNGRIAPGFWRQPRRWPGFLPSPHFPHPFTFFKTKNHLCWQVLLQPTSETPEPDLKRRKRAR